MKATGVLRRIDELGRIVIPKEIRKNLKIREGDTVEIYVSSEEEIMLKKYSSLRTVSDFAQRFTDSIYALLKHNIMVTDKDHVLAVSGHFKKEYLQQEISEELVKFMYRRIPISEKHKKTISIIENKKLEATYVIEPILANGDIVGLFMILSENTISEIEEKVAKIAAEFFMKYLEE